MANLKKFTRGAIGHMCKHFERGKTPDGELVRYGNQDIDPSRSHLNYNLAPPRESQLGFIKQRCSEVYCHNRKDVNVLCSWVVTVPKDLDPTEHERFFQSAYRFLANRYGEDNVVSAFVHKDETTPHLHFAWVPVAYDAKKDRLTVSAKLVIAKKELQEFHPALQKHLERDLGHEVHVMTGELSNRPDLTLPQYKSYMELLERVEEAEKHLEKVVKQLNDLEPVLESCRATVAKIEAIDAIQPRETLTGALRGITIEDIEQLKAAAKELEVLRKDIQKLRLDYADLQRFVPSDEEYQKRADREDRLEKLEKAIDDLPPYFKQMLEESIALNSSRGIERDRTR